MWIPRKKHFRQGGKWTTCDLRISNNPTSDNLTPKKPQIEIVPTGGMGLICRPKEAACTCRIAGSMGLGRGAAN
jgi:hypothetical protein